MYDLLLTSVQSVDPANAGLHHAISFLLPIQAANPWISHADLWSNSSRDSTDSFLTCPALAGVAAIEAMGGPTVPWQPGRSDYDDAAAAEAHRGQVENRYASHSLLVDPKLKSDW